VCKRIPFAYGWRFILDTIFGRLCSHMVATFVKRTTPGPSRTIAHVRCNTFFATELYTTSLSTPSTMSNNNHLYHLLYSPSAPSTLKPIPIHYQATYPITISAPPYSSHTQILPAQRNPKQLREKPSIALLLTYKPSIHIPA